jgi:hypothetical protein
VRSALHAGRSLLPSSISGNHFCSEARSVVDIATGYEVGQTRGPEFESR